MPASLFPLPPTRSVRAARSLLLALSFVFLAAGCASADSHGSHAGHAMKAAGDAAASAKTAIPRTPAPEGARVYVISPADGAVVSNPVVVRFGLSGMGVAPAGVMNPKTGHHHLLIDAKIPPVGMPIPSDENHRHFGGGQTEVTLELTPGRHTLQLLLGDHLHVPHDPPVSSPVVTITVQ